MIQDRIKQEIYVKHCSSIMDISWHYFFKIFNCMAISRALCQIDEENRPALKKEGLLTRDPRMVERKKFGQKKARKKFQFSKR